MRDKFLGTCDVCGSDFDRELYAVTDTNQNVHGEWSIVQCGNCKLAKLYPTPNQNEIDSFYNDSFYAQDGKRFRPTMEFLREKLAFLRGSYLRKIFPSGGKLIDIGAGSGHFGKAMQKCGWEILNFDPYNKTTFAESSNSNGSGLKSLTGEQFDVATLWYVIEHLADPYQMLMDCSRLLKPNGVLVLSQQDFSSLQAKFFGKNWLILDPPRHVFQFSADNLTELANKTGFALISVEHSSLEMGPFTILQSILNMIVGNQNYLFKFLKSGHLRLNNITKDYKYYFGVFISLILLPFLLPVAFVLYFILLFFRSGDIFTLYLRKK